MKTSKYNIQNSMTNIEFLTEFMSWGNFVNQVFVMDAIIKSAKNIVDNKDYLLKEMKDPLIHPKDWIQSAEEFLELYKEKYGEV